MTRPFPALSALRFILLLALAGLFAAGLPQREARAQEFIANQIEDLISTENLAVEIEGLSGALTGNLRIERLTVSDPQGVFLTASDLAMDWSPLALVRSNVAIESLTAGQIVLERLPQPAPADPADEGGFALPDITADIRSIVVSEFVLGEAVAGVPARLSANASLVLQDEPTRLEVQANIERLDQPGQIALNLVYAPADNRLDIDIQASEPAGGLVANLLNLPGAPPVELAINGSGPLNDFMLNGALTVGGEQAATVTARVDGTEEGSRVAASLTFAAERFVPAEFAPYLAGNTTLDLQLLLRDDGVIVVDGADLASDALAVSARGTLDPDGAGNDLSFSVASREGGAIPLGFGSGPNRTEIMLGSLEGTLAGSLDAANVALTAELPTASFGEYVAQNVSASLASEAFDVTGLTGPFAIEASAASVASPEGVADRFLEGPVRVTAEGTLTESGIAIAASQVATDVATASITGSAALDFSTFDLDLATSFDTAALSAAAIPIAGDRLSVSASLARTADGALTAEDLAVQGSGLTITGSASLADGNVTADIAGSLQEAETVNSALSGQAQFSLTAEGPVEQPNVELSLTSSGLTIGGRTLSDLTIEASGSLNPAAPSGTVRISGNLDGAPISGTADVETLPNGERRISNLTIRQGPNTITGDLRLTDNFAPVGTLDVDVEDIGPLAALAMQEASGDLSGNITLTVSDEGLPVATVDLASEALTVAGNTLRGADIALRVEDYLGQPYPQGTIRAEAIEASGADVRDLAVDFAREGDFTRLEAAARINGVPVELAGRASFSADETVIEVDRLAAGIDGAEIALSEPTRIVIEEGATSFDALVLEIGAGSIVLNGRAGPSLELTAELNQVPAAVVNPFVEGLDAAGTISGTVSVTGAANDPTAIFRITGSGIETSQTRAADLPPLGLILAGRYAGETLLLETAAVDLGEGSLSATGSIGETLSIEVALDRIPVALANGLIDGLDASGTISGTASVTGTPIDPEAVFDIAGTGITTAEIAEAGIAPVDLSLAGSFADGTATIRQARATVGSGSLTATGTVGEALDLDVALNDIPVGLVNGFVPGLGASGIVSGTVSATGTPSEPNAVFDIAAADVTTAEIAASGVPPVDLRLAGSFADGTAEIETAVANVGAGSLAASGTVGEALDLSITLSEIPVGLINGYLPDLDASGTISGTATASGSISDPVAEFQLSGTGITTEAIAAGGIPPLSLDVSGSFADGTATIETARVDVGTGSLTASGTVGQNLDLDVTVNEIPVGLANGFVPDLNASGTISGTATATGSISDPVAEFQLSGTNITTEAIAAGGVPPLSLEVAGSFADGTATIETARVDVGTGSLTASGTVGQDLDLDVTVDEIPVGLVNGFVPGLDASGTISGTATASGSISDPVAEFELSGTGITTAAVAAGGVPSLSLDVSGSYADGTATIETARVDVGTGSLTASGTVGQELDLDVTLNEIPVGLANGFAPGLGASGTISGTATASGSVSDPVAEFVLSGAGITTEALAAAGVPPLSLEASGSYADGTATVETARIDVGTGSLTVSGTVGQELDLEVALNDIPVGLIDGLVPGLAASGIISGTATATGSLSDPQVAFQLSGTGITTAAIRQSGIAPISFEISGSYADGTATIATAEASLGAGSLTASGTIGETLDLEVELVQVPVGLANAFVPDLGASGTISGTASAGGSLADPSLSFDISASGVSTAQTRAAGAPPVNASVAGSFAGGAVTLETARIDVGGGTITATGTAGETLALTVEITDVPASLLAAVAPDLDPDGSISGTVIVSGPVSSPSITYELDVAGLAIAQTRAAGIGPLNVSANGQFAGNVVTVDAELSGDGIALSASGSVGLAGATPQLDIALNGTAPLSLANQFLAEGGRSVEGTVAVDARITGPASAPSVVGTISTSGAEFVDVGANLAINDIAATIALNGDVATIQSFSASLASGGTIAISGTVGLAGGFPADLAIRIIDGRYNDGEIVSLELDAALTLTGPLAGTPLLAGTVNADEINVLVPETMPTSLARIDVTHRNASAAVLEQQREIRPESAEGAGGSGLVLDVVLNAPNQVFVRGRGLDVELGGSVRIAGPLSSLSVTGGFELQRGRFRILGTRLDFERGRLSFTGDLVPTLDLLAVSDAGDVTVMIVVTGPADDPSFNFSSTPPLPQDEVLARLIFGQGTSDLSPLQIAQLAEAAASLAGVGGSTGLLENLRSLIGVDDLDIRTTEDGETAVGVGEYLNDNTYLGVDSTGRVSIDLDLGSGLKARGAVSADGGGEVGIFYEQEY